jgi:hypothetical protein
MVRNHWPTIKALAEGEPTSEKLPTWRRKKQEVTAFDDLDDDTDVPF